MKLSGIFPEGTGCAVAEILILADQLQGGQKQRREREKEASARREAQLDSRSDTRGGKYTGRLTGPGKEARSPRTRAPSREATGEEEKDSAGEPTLEQRLHPFVFHTKRTIDILSTRFRTSAARKGGCRLQFEEGCHRRCVRNPRGAADQSST